MSIVCGACVIKCSRFRRIVRCRFDLGAAVYAHFPQVLGVQDLLVAVPLSQRPLHLSLRISSQCY
jgi:hypothetical protein